MQTHLLLCDIGNTTLKIGVADEKRVLTSYCLPVQNEETADSFGFTLLSLLTHARVAPDSILAAAISSVVPRMDSLVREAVSRYLDCSGSFSRPTICRSRSKTVTIARRKWARIVLWARLQPEGFSRPRNP